MLSAAEAVFVSSPAALGRTVIVTVVAPPTASGPTLAVTVPPACPTLPWVVPADTKAAPAGRGSVTTTPVASEGPALRTATR